MNEGKLSARPWWKPYGNRAPWPHQPVSFGTIRGFFIFGIWLGWMLHWAVVGGW